MYKASVRDPEDASSVHVVKSDTLPKLHVLVLHEVHSRQQYAEKAAVNLWITLLGLFLIYIAMLAGEAPFLLTAAYVIGVGVYFHTAPRKYNILKHSRYLKKCLRSWKIELDRISAHGEQLR